MQQHGIHHVYGLYTHPAPGAPPAFIYGPVYMYMLHLYGKWQGAAQEIRPTVYQFKSVVLLFNIVGIWFALRLLREKANQPFFALLIKPQSVMFLPAFSLLWLPVMRQQPLMQTISGCTRYFAG